MAYIALYGGGNGKSSDCEDEGSSGGEPGHQSNTGVGGGSIARGSSAGLHPGSESRQRLHHQHQDDQGPGRPRNKSLLGQPPKSYSIFEGQYARLLLGSGNPRPQPQRGMKEHLVGASLHHQNTAHPHHHHHQQHPGQPQYQQLRAYPHHHHHHGGIDVAPKTMLYKTGRCFRSFYFIVLSRTVLVLGFLFVAWQGYKNCKAHEELCQMTRDSLEAIRVASAACNYINEPVHVSLPTSAKLCNAVSEYNELKKIGIDEPIIYVITPTFSRALQKAELTRVSQTFMLIPNLHWIVVEDSPNKTPLVTNLLNDSGLTYTHINAPTPTHHKLTKNDPNWKKPRGVEQRNAALRWIRANLNESHNGVIFFGDDDNTYSRHLFKELAKVKRVGVWPVGLVGGLRVEGPICNRNTNKVTGFNAIWKPDRPFPIDMAGFGINLKVILEKKNAYFTYDTQSGLQESEILKKVTTRDELEPLADYCTKIYVWHTRTVPPKYNEKITDRYFAGVEV